MSTFSGRSRSTSLGDTLPPTAMKTAPPKASALPAVACGLEVAFEGDADEDADSYECNCF